MATTPKKPWVAFLLSIILTGAGLAYLGRWGWAVLNLVAAIGICVAAVLIYPEVASPLGIGIGVGSAVMAKTLAEKMNKEAEAAAVSMQHAGALPPPVPVITVSSDNFSRRPPEPILVKPATVTCSKCGFVVEPANFCSECGGPIS